VLKRLNAFPSGLDSLCKRMMQQINESDDTDLCKQILALIVIVYWHVTLDELTTLIKQLEDITDDKEKREIISLCGLFLPCGRTPSTLCISLQRTFSLTRPLIKSI
jgi:hypothetical protein